MKLIVSSGYGNIYVELGRLALQKDEVKEFARRMIDDHTAADAGPQARR